VRRAFQPYIILRLCQIFRHQSEQKSSAQPFKGLAHCLQLIIINIIRVGSAHRLLEPFEVQQSDTDSPDGHARIIIDIAIPAAEIKHGADFLR
jgi:hypothetical protein